VLAAVLAPVPDELLEDPAPAADFPFPDAARERRRAEPPRRLHSRR
jgi:hypothetical protein